MSDAPSQRFSPRNLRDGGFTLGLMTVAIAFGYVVLPAPAGSATTGSRSDTVGTVVVPSAEHEVAPERVKPATAPAAVTSRPRVRMVAVPPAESPRPKLAPLIEPPRAPRPPAIPHSIPGVTWPSATVSGHVLDAERKPAAGASIVLRGREVFTSAEGAFKLDNVPPDAPLLVKLPGYEKVLVPPTRGTVEVTLKPQAIKAAYLTYFGVGDRGIRGRVLDLIARTELNAVVIDVKGDRGWVLYRTEVPLAQAAGAQGPGTLKDFDAMMADFKARGIYTIARIVTFKDNILAHHRPDWAVIDTRTGGPWIDNEKLAWVDPFREEVWAYNIALAQEALQRGFDEVQFDYVRFPTDGKLGAARYSRPNTRETRLPAVAGFLARARRELGPSGGFVAADLFGYTAFNENDTDIGQRIEELAPHLDFICPMVYPSGYHKGIPGFVNPVQHPYEVVRESVRLICKRAGRSVARVRPWLQDFRDYAFDRRIFGVNEIRAQVQGSDDGGGVGFMLWNPRNDYTGAALRQKGSLAAQ